MIQSEVWDFLTICSDASTMKAAMINKINTFLHVDNKKRQSICPWKCVFVIVIFSCQNELSIQ